MFIRFHAKETFLPEELFRSLCSSSAMPYRLAVAGMDGETWLVKLQQLDTSDENSWSFQGYYVSKDSLNNPVRTQVKGRYNVSTQAIDAEPVRIRVRPNE